MSKIFHFALANDSEQHQILVQLQTDLTGTLNFNEEITTENSLFNHRHLAHFDDFENFELKSDF